MRLRLLTCLLALAWACDDGGSGGEGGGPAPEPDAAPVDAGVDAALPDAEPPPSCATQAIYAPAEGSDGAFPDDAWTVADPAAATGLRVNISVETAPWIAEIPASYQPVFDAVSALDGWGTNAELFLRFDAPLAPFEGMHPSVRLLELGGEAPVELPYTVAFYEGGTRLGLTPIRPLRPGKAHAMVVTADVPTETEGCVAPAEGLAALLDGRAAAEHLQPLIPRYAALAEQLGDADAWVHAVLFTTQSVFDDSRAVAADIAERSFSWNRGIECEQRTGRRICRRTFRAGDYRVDGVVQPPPTRRTYDLPVLMVIPDGEGPFPTIFCGHGLSGNKNFCQNTTGYLTDPAVILAVDAPHHGEHPAGASANPVDLLRNFFAADILTRTIDGPRLRDNFRTATFDRLQLLRLAQQAPDLDGDGKIDVDVERMGYFGVSLGGIMASEFLALADGVTAAKLNVPGARLTQIMRDAANFAPLVQVLTPPNQPDGRVAMIFAAIQIVLEQGDPANWAPHVTRDRMVGAPAHVFLTMAMNDAVVPNSATRNLARALGVPIVPPVLAEWTHIDIADGSVSANMTEGTTGGLVQLDRVTSGVDGATEVADHNNTAFSSEVRAMAKLFFDAWAAGELPVIE